MIWKEESRSSSFDVIVLFSSIYPCSLQIICTKREILVKILIKEKFVPLFLCGWSYDKSCMMTGVDFSVSKVFIDLQILLLYSYKSLDEYQIDTRLVVTTLEKFFSCYCYHSALKPSKMFKKNHALRHSTCFK